MWFLLTDKNIEDRQSWFQNSSVLDEDHYDFPVNVIGRDVPPESKHIPWMALLAIHDPKEV